MTVPHPGGTAYDPGKWLAARLELPEAEKELTRRSDELARRRRELPRAPVEKDHRSAAENGDAPLRDLSGARSQLLVCHPMFEPDRDEGCPGCPAVTGGFAGSIPHVEHHDAAFAVVSRAPPGTLAAYQRPTGWDVRRVSSSGSSLNCDFHMTAGPAVAPVEHNCKDRAQLQTQNAAWPGRPGEQPARSALARDGDHVPPTYSAYSRGSDRPRTMSQWPDRPPPGRDEGGMPWSHRHDQYPATPAGPSRHPHRPPGCQQRNSRHRHPPDDQPALANNIYDLTVNGWRQP